MKIIVSGKRGLEAISLTSPVTVKEARERQELSVLRSGEGTEHFFRRDGSYDGWGIDVSGREMTEDEAKELIKTVESQRDFLAPKSI